VEIAGVVWRETGKSAFLWGTGILGEVKVSDAVDQLVMEYHN
jgi:hypothetical protein